MIAQCSKQHAFTTVSLMKTNLRAHTFIWESWEYVFSYRVGHSDESCTCALLNAQDVANQRQKKKTTEKLVINPLVQS